MKVIPYPDHWMSHKPLPEMKGKSLGIFAHCFVRDGEQETLRGKYQRIYDMAIEENTCTVLSGSLSLVQPNHHLLYEEWADYDEFFEVQVARTYRKGFFRWLDPIRSGAVSPEFTEMFHSTGKHPFNVAYNAYTLVQSVHVASGCEEDARKLFIQYVDDVGKDPQNILANIHQSINNPQHFLLYEIWSDFSYLVESELNSDRRIELEARFNELKDEDLPEPAMEIFQIYYDPEKYVPSDKPF
jgi:quinol monooxygenase YgiN